jgi:hypothetical protein
MSELKAIAQEMREYALAHVRTGSGDIEPYRRELSRGLRVVLYVDVNGTWHLSMYREGVYPSEAEVRIIRRDFAVPDDARTERQVVGRHWYVVRLEWREAGQVKLFEVGPASGAAYYKE